MATSCKLSSFPVYTGDPVCTGKTEQERLANYCNWNNYFSTKFSPAVKVLATELSTCVNWIDTQVNQISNDKTEIDGKVTLVDNLANQAEVYRDQARTSELNIKNMIIPSGATYSIPDIDKLVAEVYFALGNNTLENQNNRDEIYRLQEKNKILENNMNTLHLGETLNECYLDFDTNQDTPEKQAIKFAVKNELNLRVQAYSGYLDTVSYAINTSDVFVPSDNAFIIHSISTSRHFEVLLKNGMIEVTPRGRAGTLKLRVWEIK